MPVHGQVELNPEQELAAAHGSGPLLILAGAGTGKTRVLVHRIVRLLRARVPPWQILAVTFTNKAATEMRHRLRSLLGLGAERMWIGTFHGTCARLLRTYGGHLGLPRDFLIYDEDDQKRIINTLLKEGGFDEMITVQAVRSRIDRARNRGEDPTSASYASSAWGANASWGDDVMKTVYPQYRERLAREGAVDFNDLLLNVLELAEHPEVGPELASLFQHVLVDEFQDTNLVQYRLVRHLSRVTRNLTVVGDDDQAIYSWRGAEPRNLLDFDRDFPDATVIKLEQNYRSTQIILNGANAVIEHNRNRHEKALWSDRAGGEPILWEECADERGEADFIARAVRGLVSEEGRDLGDIAVLYRTHAQSRVLEEQLRRYDIPYRIVGGVSFFQRKEIKDIIAYLSLLINPSADSYFERIVNVPARGIGKTTIDRVRAHAKVAGISELDAARSCSCGAVAALGPAPRKKLAAFIDIMNGLRDVQAAGASVTELIIQAVERSGYRERLEIEDTPESRDRLENLSELVSMASDFDDGSGGAGTTLVDFLERLSLSSANDEEDGRGNTRITLMTIHAAKGLEFPVVFMCGMEEGLFPSLREREGTDERDALEEERRLAYVAMTRAMERLVLTNARVRRQWGEVRINFPSRFIDEIPAECMAVRARAAAARVVVPDPELGRMRRPTMAARASHDELDQRVQYDDMPEYHADEHGGRERAGGGGIQAGVWVSHASFGDGKVIKAQGAGRDRKLLIDFSEVGLKTVLERFVERT